MNITMYRESDGATAAARALATRTARAIGERGTAVIGVPGGRSAISVFTALAGASLAWDRVELFPADERCVALDSSESNYRLVQEELLRRIASTGSRDVPRLHAYIDEPPGREESLAGFNARFAAAVPRTRFDALLLGVGEDGHVASLFPKHSALESKESRYLFVGDSPKPPAERITIAPNLIRSARTVILLLFGEGKREALKALLSADQTFRDCPARLALESRECLVFTDLE